ncbi:PTS alpha-glucoside transporter subunit IIBC [Methanocella sp. CWC-04]|uniref:PTS alpha-glucoside transporter subunit IIBC n=1 Tax=Methanooceanicella nereidis TaxID=2052831 RepID=A0AAP2W748_9EURY|nr:PTS alpha-glucoside transporter subunit IIBC [Methanocella sp. CWC-04]MCD1294869.1 PTS alpha-glucoside transporter subunit IIBC [Methanocella sp. CWC-04]
MDVIIVCHTEFGRTKNNTVIYDKDVKEGVSLGVPNLIKVADRYGAKVTFAVMPEVVEYFPAGTGHEIGLHIHPGWGDFEINGEKYTVGDSYLRRQCDTSSDSTVLKDYPYNEQLDMIRVGKDLISDSLGTGPKVFVAGRWSINDDTIRALIKSGFSHECSAPAHKVSGHYDWSRLPRICMPYRPGPDYQENGDLPILIMPISQTFMGASVNPEIIPLIGLSWLRSCFLEYYRQKLPLFHICLHSPCMCDPYFIDNMDRLLKFISKFNVGFKFASSIGEYPEVSPRTDILPYIGGMNANLLRACLNTFQRRRASLKI